MPQSKPPDLDDNLNPEQPPDLDDNGSPVVNEPVKQHAIPSPPEAFLSSIYHQLSDPLTDAPSRATKWLSEHQPAAEQMRGDNSWHDTFAKIDNQMRGFNQGAGEAIGDLVSGLSSPANLGMAIASGGSSMAGKAGLSSVAKLLLGTSRGLAIPGMIHGGSEVIDPESTIGQRGQGLVELAGNASAFAHNPTAAKTKPTIDTGGTPPPTARPFFEESTRIIPPEKGGIEPIPDDFFNRIGPEKPTAEYGYEEHPDWVNPGESPSRYTVRGGPQDGSSVGEGTLRELGIDIPERSVTPPTLPEFAPTDVIPEQPTSQTPVKTQEELSYELGRNKFNMGQDMPDSARSSSVRPELPPATPDFVNQVTGELPNQPREMFSLSPEDATRILQRRATREGISAEPIPEVESTLAPELTNELPEIPPAESLANEGHREFISLGDEQAGRSNDTSGLPPKKSLENAPLGQTIIIRKEGATPNAIKRAKEAGYQYEGLNEQGHFRFKKVTEPSVGPILETEVGETRPTNAGVKEQLGPLADQRGSNLVEAFNLPRGIMAAGDLSAPLRQGIGLIHKKSFWTSLKPMFQAWMTEDGFRNSQNAIAQRPLFRERAGVSGKTLPSFADDAGLKLTDLTDLSKREEAIMSTWAEKVPGVRRSNRAYTAFLNNLRADTFESLVKDGKIFGADAKANLPLARELANFVNIASGRGSLGKLETSAVALNSMFFSPRLIASRIQMMNPHYYIMASPQVRKEALKSLFAIAAAGNVVTGLGRMVGGTVSADPTSSDFGKLKIGNTRVDPYGGFQQYIVAASRLMSGKVTSSTSGNEYDLNDPQGPYDPTHADIATRFVRGKVHPVIGFAWSLMSGKKEMSGEEMNFSTPNPMENAVAQRFIPILAQDLYELAQDEDMPPALKVAVGAASAFGMGQQTYGSQ